MSANLTCPACGHDADPARPDERFCIVCGTPLVAADGPHEAELSERQARARKIKRQYSEGELVRVAGGRNQTEAEFIQGLLLEEGVPSILRRTRGFDVPDFLAAGPRDVLVPASGAPTAREVLLQAELAPAPGAGAGAPIAPARVLAGLLGGVGVVAVIVAVADALLG